MLPALPLDLLRTGYSFPSWNEKADVPGYVFQGWSSKPGKGELIGFSFKPNVLRNVTLYADWERDK